MVGQWVRNNQQKIINANIMKTLIINQIKQDHIALTIKDNLKKEFLS